MTPIDVDRCLTKRGQLVHWTIDGQYTACTDRYYKAVDICPDQNEPGRQEWLNKNRHRRTCQRCELKIEKKVEN